MGSDINRQAELFCSKNSVPDYGSIEYADTKLAGARYLRIGFTRPIPVGSVLVRGGGTLSVLTENKKYPGNLADDLQWVAAVRIDHGIVGHEEGGRAEYAVWVLPPKTWSAPRNFPPGRMSSGGTGPMLQSVQRIAPFTLNVYEKQMQGHSPTPSRRKRTGRKSSDIPSEAMLTPQLWGKWEFVQT